MPNSTGTATFTVDRDSLIKASLRVIWVTDPEGGPAPSATMLSNGAEALNLLLKNWMSQGLILSTYQQLAIPMVAGTQSYTIGPSGAAVTSTRPLRLFDGSFIRNTVTNVDTPLQILTRQAYLQQTTKTVQGSTTGIYYLPSIDVAGGVTNPGTGWGTLFVYFPSADATHTVYANFQRPLYDMSAATDAFDIPVEWQRALKYALAAEIAYEYGLPANTIQLLEAKAEALKRELELWTVDQATAQFGEDRQRQERARDQIDPSKYQIVPVK